MAVIEKYVHGQFSWVDLNSKNMGEAMQFYSDLFGWNCDVQDTQGGPPYSIFKLDGKMTCGMGQMSEEMIGQGIPSIWNNYVNVEDCEAVCERVAELGGTVFMPTMKVFDAGSMAFVTDPGGAMFALWQADQHSGAEAVNIPGTFVWNELATRDFEGSIEFYGQLFGWEFKDNPGSPGKYKIIVNQGRDNGGIMEMDDQWDEEIPPHWGVYFTVENVDESAAKVTAGGGKICHGPFDAPPVGRIAICSDPHGGTFSLIEFGPDAVIPD